MMGKYILGIDLGGTKIAAAVVDRQGNILSWYKEFTKIHKGADGVISQMIKISEKVIKDANIKRKTILGIGIGAVGPLNTKRGIIISPYIIR